MAASRMTGASSNAWQVKAREEGRLRIDRRSGQAGASAQPERDAALDAWKKIALALANSENREDQTLARDIVEFLKEGPTRRKSKLPEHKLERATKEREFEQAPQRGRSVAERGRAGPDIRR